MKLTYRGHQYKGSFSPMDVVESELTGKYRGQSADVRYPSHIPMPQTPHPLKYRGVSNSDVEPKHPLNEVSSLGRNQIEPVETRQSGTARLAHFEKALDENLAQVHTNHLCRLLERRRQAAAARGDRHLLRLLDLEAKQIAC
ncbi:MAG TPA: hypothetical protein DCQ51_02620 [Planktothrix sp. UBA8407]|jgi:hypothetical protein|nr:hypothetical protein [Planktothrix sp. UBA8402]HAO10085.1 hypothetical protein [Planktothrix sp. UBA8407]HBK22246.1 hypothetical protein [Planktothrix sp. UBA10369]